MRECLDKEGGQPSHHHGPSHHHCLPGLPQPVSLLQHRSCSTVAHDIPAENASVVPHLSWDKVQTPSNALHDRSGPAPSPPHSVLLSSHRLLKAELLPASGLYPLLFPLPRMLFPLPIWLTPPHLSGISLSIWSAGRKPSWPPSFSPLAQSFLQR